MHLGGTFFEHFSSMKDPRVSRTRRHNLIDIVVIAVCAILCGADSWTEIALFGRCKRDWFKTFLTLPNGIPSQGIPRSKMCVWKKNSGAFNVTSNQPKGGHHGRLCIVCSRAEVGCRMRFSG